MPDRNRLADRYANLYEFLQVSPRADSGVIHAAYRALARQYHPDVNASVQASSKMREINAAYHVLGDPERRARYDAHRARFPARRIGRQPSAAPAPGAHVANGRGSSVRAVPTMPRTAGETRPVVAAIVFSLIMVGFLILAVVLVVTSLEDRPPNAVGAPLSLLEARGSGAWATALDRR